MIRLDRRLFLSALGASLVFAPAARAQVAATRADPALRRETLALPGAIDVGGAGADVTLVEFFDYNCTVCRAAGPDIATLLRGDRKLRLVLVNIPSLGIPSIEAAKVALAFARQTTPGRYYEFHQRLYGLRGTINGNRTLAIAGEMGADIDRLIDMANDPSVGRALGLSARLADRLGARVTPSYLVGERFVSGTPGIEGFRTLIAAARAG